MAATSSVVKAGWLEKKGTGLSKWKKWWCVLDVASLRLYAKAPPLPPKAKESVAMRGADFVSVDDHPGQFRIAIRHEGSEDTILRYESEDERQEWLAALRARAAMPQDSVDGSREPSAMDGEADDAPEFLLPALSYEASAAYVGWIHKSPLPKRAWKRMFCVILGHVLFVYKKDKDCEPESAIALPGWVALPSSEAESGKAHSFKVSKDGTRYLLGTEDDESLRELMAAVRAAAALPVAAVPATAGESENYRLLLQDVAECHGVLEHSEDGRKFKKRFAVAANLGLYLYKSPKDIEPVDAFPLLGAKVAVERSLTHAVRLRLVDGTTVVVQCADAKEHTTWLSVLEQVAANEAVMVDADGDPSSSVAFVSGSSLVQLTVVANCALDVSAADLEAAVAAFHRQLNLPAKAQLAYFVSVNKPQTVHPSVRAAIRSQVGVDIAGRKRSLRLGPLADGGDDDENDE